MTVDELILLLQQASANGHGDKDVWAPGCLDNCRVRGLKMKDYGLTYSYEVVELSDKKG